MQFRPIAFFIKSVSSPARGDKERSRLLFTTPDEAYAETRKSRVEFSTAATMRTRHEHFNIIGKNIMDDAIKILEKLAKQMESVQMHIIEGSHGKALTEISHSMQFIKDALTEREKTL